MQKFLSTARTLSLLAGALALLATPLIGQDDNGAAPPPPENSAPAPDDSSAAPDDGASFQTFYDGLASQGTWIQSNDYGYVWQPQVSDPNWAPYTDGHWVYTDDGWTWVSDESFGWATYHYGRWANIDGTGWVWIPGYTWAPAWVSWRYGDGYCGWAPLPPDSFVGVDYYGAGFSIGIGFHIGGDCDNFYGIGAGWYNFLPVNCLGYRHYHGYYRNRHDNFSIINRTTNVTNINVTRNGANGATAGGGRFHHVTTGGPQLAQVNAVSQTPVQRVNLVRSNQRGGGELSGNSLALYAPHVSPATTAQPLRVSGSIERATINRGTEITRPLAVNSHLMPAPATQAQVQEAQLAQSHAPVNAKVVTANTEVKPILRAPLTSLKPASTITPTHTFNTTPNTFSNTQRSLSNPVVNPTERTYPQTSEQRAPSTQVVPTERTYPQTSEQRTPSTQVIPTERTYPQTSVQESAPSRVYNNNPAPVYPSNPSTYQNHSSPTSTGGGAESHTYERPSTPSYSAPAAAPHSSGGGSSGGSSGSSGGGASHSSSGGGGGSSHGSGGSSQSHR